MSGNQVYLKWRANERRAELVRAMPSAADIMKLPSRRQSYAKIVQGERNQVYLNCRAAANLMQRLCKASAIFVQASAIELALIAERSRKCQEIKFT